MAENHQLRRNIGTKLKF